MFQAINDQVKTFHFRDKNILVVSDGDVPYDNNCFAPGISRKELHMVLQRGVAYISLAHNILVLAWDDCIVLIDAGNGYATLPEGGKLVTNLKAADIAPDKVTDIVLTHAHPDHLGGLVDLNNQLIFPLAKIYLSTAEYEFWQSDTPDFSRSRDSAIALFSIQQNIKQRLNVLKEQLWLFNENDLLLGCLQPVAAMGHTPGHFMFNVTVGKETFLHMADICHEETLLFSRPEWGTIFDIDF
ncbi:MBL fold metallo-hydrolase [Chitinophaga pendula]|uniref:MBL fold metallo-hydrolase n=1 Tax=Chitinophaga TaxID=79328 RepID=UPI000BB0075D|nr:MULTISPECIES: MBL fold metallo-hydrolase [Chitinophaga]ASZ14062.1 hypothetical protein CK934_25485 [Chitinophaga sp. MD30]UCJ08307.1 MBL fold metallo-hydrolase [Chitinophaga pendula]